MNYEFEYYLNVFLHIGVPMAIVFFIVIRRLLIISREEKEEKAKKAKADFEKRRAEHKAKQNKNSMPRKRRR